MEARKFMSEAQKILLVYFLVLLCPVIKVNEKLQWPNPGRITKCRDSPGMKELVALPGQEPRPTEILAEVSCRVGSRGKRL